MFIKLQKKLNYFFKNIKLLEEALTHPSMSYNIKKSKYNYERLEILGDSVLSCIIMEYLFTHHVNDTDGELSKRKAVLVSKNTLSNIAKNLGLGEYIIMTNGEEICGGRNNNNNLENVLESVIGAIFLDSNFETVREVILKWGIIEIDEQQLTAPKDVITELQEWVQKNFKILPIYNVIPIDNNIFSVSLQIPEYDTMNINGTNIKQLKNTLAKLMLNKIKNK